MASPPVVVHEDKNICITVNNKRLNRVTVVRKTLISRIDEVFDSVGEEKIFRASTLASGFFQSAIHPDAVLLTAFCTPSGLYDWLRMPQDAATVPGCFQRFMQRVTKGREHVIMYLDDGKDFDASLIAHARTLRKSRARLQMHYLSLPPSEARVGATASNFVGHSISSAVLHTDTNNVRAMAGMPMPTNISQLRSLLGEPLLSQCSAKCVQTGSPPYRVTRERRRVCLHP